jgi:hypothetical protein
MVEKKGFFSNNLFPKIIILLAIGVVISAVLFGLPTDLGSGFWFIVRIILAIGMFALAIKIMEKVVTGKNQFSPSETWRKKLIRSAEMSKPPRTKKLWLRGNDGHMHYYFGKITGLLLVPYWSGKPVMDENGKYKYTERMGKDGKPVLDINGKPIMVNEFANITNRDADWIFVISRGIIPLLSKTLLVRAHRDLCSDIGEEVWIKSVNLVPIGDWYYPEQMFQSDILRINHQSLHEVVEESYQHFLDMTATVVESALRSDPMFVKMMTANTENISNKESAPIQSFGSGQR